MFIIFPGKATVSTTSNSLPPLTKIIWAALTFSQLIYAIVGVFIIPAQEVGSPNDIVLYGLLGSSFIAIGVALLVIPTTSKVNSLSAVVTPFIIQWALVESAAVFGLVGKFMGGSNTFLCGLTFLSVIFMVILFPTEKRAQAFLRKDQADQEE